MTAISKAWVTIADGAVDADSPLDQALLTGLRDDLIHLREWLGASYTAGAVQNHSHDGFDSALIDVGPSYIRNGSFESGVFTNWTTQAFTGGTVSITSTAANVVEGNYATAITSTVIANGGGTITTNNFIPVAGSFAYRLSTYVKASVANVSSKGEVIWYDNAFSQISVSTIYSSSNTETSYTAKDSILVAPATARYCFVRFTGGVPGVGSSAGTIYFDSTFFGTGLDGWLRSGKPKTHFSPYEGSTASGSYVKVLEILSGGAGTATVAFDLLTTGAGTAFGRIYVNGTPTGTERSTASTTAVTYTEDIAIVYGDLVQIYSKISGAGSAVTSRFHF